MAKSVAHRPKGAPVVVSREKARRIWLRAQRLDEESPFGSGSEAVARAVAHLGYVQIDTINVIERCHHHILYNRIPTYHRNDLAIAQSEEKTVFEYWTHALSYLPVTDLRFFTGTMKEHRTSPAGWGGVVSPYQLRKTLNRVRDEGALTIADIKDDRLVEKAHLWASRKPSKRALQAGFYSGRLMISKREGMLKSYELTERHFGWDRLPKPATPLQIVRYHLDRVLRTQGIISLDSVLFGPTRIKPPVERVALAELIEREVRAKRLVPVALEGAESVPHWAPPQLLEENHDRPVLTHILSPFDPLIIQRRRTARIFGYDHLFEAYVPKAKRKLGYFALPVLVGDKIVAAIDLKTDRQARTVLIQAWHWVGEGNAADHKQVIEEALERFERFQLAD